MIFRSRRLNKKVVFFHIMKTGGMTFRSILSSVYGRAFHLCSDPSISSIEASLAAFDCLEFHTMVYKDEWVRLHDELARQRRWDLLEGTNVFTMLRDPVDHFLSQYYYLVSLRASVEPVLNAKGISFPKSLEEFIESPAAFNLQLEFLVGKSQWAGNYVNDDDLEEAKQVLVGLKAHIGLTERFADSVRVFESVTGRQVPKQKIRIHNQNRSRPPLETTPDRLRKTILERSTLDLGLYQFAREMFAHDLAVCDAARAYSFRSALARGRFRG